MNKRKLINGGGPFKEDLVQDEELVHVTWTIAWTIALIIWLTKRSADADVVARSVRELLWESPSQPPSIVTPSNFNRREDDIED